jgi:uncharacterized protein YjdB
MPQHTRRTVRTLEILMFAVLTAVSVAACGSSTTPSTVSAITVTGGVPSVGTTSQLTATAVLSDNTTQDVTSTSTWSSSNTSIATVSATGLVTGVASGTAVIQAIYGNISGTESLVIPVAQ